MGECWCVYRGVGLGCLRDIRGVYSWPLAVLAALYTSTFWGVVELKRGGRERRLELLSPVIIVRDGLCYYLVSV